MVTKTFCDFCGIEIDSEGWVGKSSEMKIVDICQNCHEWLTNNPRGK